MSSLKLPDPVLVLAVKKRCLPLLSKMACSLSLSPSVIWLAFASSGEQTKTARLRFLRSFVYAIQRLSGDHDGSSPELKLK